MTMPTAITSTHAPSQAGQRLVHALAVVLYELRCVITDLPSQTYGAQQAEVFGRASIGGHVRHCLDHVRALVDGQAAGIVDYDHRERGTPVEADPAAAVAEIKRLEEGVRSLSECGSGDDLFVRIIPARDGDEVVLKTTVDRELAFVLSHTIHHGATIRSVLIALGRSVPETFGYAPATLAHMDRRSCVR